MAIEITRRDHDSASLRRLGRGCSDGYQTLRLYALADILDGFNRTQAAERHGMARQTLRDWVHRYNDEGVDGLKDKPGRGRKARIGPEVQTQLRSILLEGPDPERDGVVRWRIVDLQAWLKREHEIVCEETAVRRMVHKLGGS